MHKIVNQMPHHQCLMQAYAAENHSPQRTSKIQSHQWWVPNRTVTWGKTRMFQTRDQDIHVGRRCVIVQSSHCGCRIGLLH